MLVQIQQLFSLSDFCFVESDSYLRVVLDPFLPLGYQAIVNEDVLSANPDLSVHGCDDVLERYKVHQLVASWSLDARLVAALTALVMDIKKLLDFPSHCILRG